MDILKTTDYNIFNKSKFNRPVNRGNVTKLKAIISENNNLHLHPILVNSNMEVIDGQHRLEVAKSLNIPVYYIKDKDVKDVHILHSNLYQNKLSLMDVLRFYALLGKKDYSELLDYIEQLGVSPKGALTLLIPNNGITARSISEGDFILPTNRTMIETLIKYYTEFFSFCLSKRLKPLNMFKSYNFTKSFRKLCIHPEFKFDLFLGKIEQRWYELKPQASSDDWFALLVKIYNWKNRDAIYETPRDETAIS